MSKSLSGGLFDQAPLPAPTEAQIALRRHLGSCEACGQHPADPPSALCEGCRPPTELIQIPDLARSGKDWRRYKDKIIAKFKQIPPERRREFRRAQAVNLSLLHDAAKDLWTDMNMEMADCEREGAA